MSADICATCRRVMGNQDSWRSVCEKCFPPSWGQQKERDDALDQLQTTRRLLDIATAKIVALEKALRYAAECSTLEMVRDTARGMGVIQ
jgi:hypothetical protein